MKCTPAVGPREFDLSMPRAHRCEGKYANTHKTAQGFGFRCGIYVFITFSHMITGLSKPEQTTREALVNSYLILLHVGDM